MTQLPEGRSGKALALMIAVLGLGVIYLGVVSPVLAYYDANALRLQDRRETLARFEAAARDLPRLKAQAQKLRDQPGEAGLLFSASSDAVAAADVQSMMKDLVEAGSAKLASAQTLPAESRGNLRRVGVRVSFSGDLTLLTGVLLGIESAHPALSIGGLELHSAGDDEGGALTVAMDVYGFRSQ